MKKSSMGKKGSYGVKDKEHDSGMSHKRERPSFGKDAAASDPKVGYAHQGGKKIHMCNPSGKM